MDRREAALNQMIKEVNSKDICCWLMAEKGVLVFPVINYWGILRGKNGFQVSRKELQQLPEFFAVQKCISVSKEIQNITEAIRYQKTYGAGYLNIIDRINYKAMTGKKIEGGENFKGTWSNQTSLINKNMNSGVKEMLNQLINDCREQEAIPCILHHVPIKDERGSFPATIISVITSPISKGCEYPIVPIIPTQK
jgi:hypothetical protein